jgi:alpha-methylacyl-CoA racemase
VLIEPFRPGVLESLDLSPATLLKHNPRLIIARLTGFRRDGKYKDMAGHDINYLAVSGILSRLGRPNERPQPPANLLGDFAGGGLMCAFGIVMALFARTVTGKGQVVEENMVDAVSSIGAFVRLGRSLAFAGPRGTNLLDGGSPFYDTYETKDGRYMAVGALEPQFFETLVTGLGLQHMGLAEGRMEKQNWPRIRDLFEKTFKSKTRDEWERVFDGTDACCTPVLEHEELRKSGHQIREAVTLTDTPGVDVVEKESWVSEGLGIGEGGEDTLREWLGWQRGREYLLEKGALVAAPGAKL